MSSTLDELLPVLSVSLFDRSEVEGLVLAALDGAVAFVPLEDPPIDSGAYMLELHAPDRTAPILIAGQLAGEADAGMCPMVLRPLDDKNAGELWAFLQEGSRDALAPSEDGAHPGVVAVLSQDTPLSGEAESDVDPAPRDAWFPGPPSAPGAAVSLQELRRTDPGSARRPELRILTPRVPSKPPTFGKAWHERRAAIVREPTVREVADDAERPSPISRGASPTPTTVTLPSPSIDQSIHVITPHIDVVSPIRQRPQREPVLPEEPSEAPEVPGTSEATAAEDGVVMVTSTDDAAEIAPLDGAEGRPSVTNDPLLGRTLAGKYFISALIGAGGAGSVYRARHRLLEKDIAIKVMHPSMRSDPTFAQRFHAEALAASKLDHPNVLRVLDFGEEPDGLLYIVMELLTGTELRAILWQGQLAPERAIEIACQICAALSVAAELGVVHRDIKPENVVVSLVRDDEGNEVDLVKVCDFGLATVRRTDAAGRDTPVDEGFLGGTPEYMSPEQAIGERLDGRSDLYAVGVMLFELFAGAVPFTAETPVEILKKHLGEEPPDLLAVAPETDSEVAAIVARALAKRREDRFANAREMRAQLRAVLERLRRPAAAPEPAEPPATTLDDPSAGFGELFVALTAAVARTTYYEREHPEFSRSLVRLVQAVRAPLLRRGEITIARRDIRDHELVVQTGVGELYDLRRVLAAGVAEAYAPRLSEVLTRRHIVSLTLKEGVPEAELADMAELLSGPDVPVDALRVDFAARGLATVSVLFAEEMVGKARRLPWQVELCMSRLARDLRTLPLLRGVTEDRMRKLRVQLVADVVRTLQKPEEVRLLLENTDLVSAAVQHVPELASLDLRRVIVSSLRSEVAVEVGKALIAPPGKGSGQWSAQRSVSDGRALLQVFAERFLRDRSAEGDAVVRVAVGESLLAASDVPGDLRAAIEAEHMAAKLREAPGEGAERLRAAPDLEACGESATALAAALLVLAAEGDVAALDASMNAINGLAGSAKPGASSVAALAAQVIAAVGNAKRLAPVARAMLFGPAQHREAAKHVLVRTGAAGAKALVSERLAARAGSPEEAAFPRPRFVAALRDIGKPALPVLAEQIARLDPNATDAPASSASGTASLVNDPLWIEDLLRALPDAQDEALGRAVARFLQHPSPGARRAAAAALVGLLRERAQPALTHALDDVDDGVRAVALKGLRALHAIDEAAVARIDRLLSGISPASEELRAGAAGALAEAEGSARPKAVEALVRAIRPKSRSLVSLFKPVDDTESPMFVVTAARVLLTIGGDDGRKEVERRAAASRGEIKKSLLDLLGAPKA